MSSGCIGIWWYARDKSSVENTVLYVSKNPKSCMCGLGYLSAFSMLLHSILGSHHKVIFLVFLLYQLKWWGPLTFWADLQIPNLTIFRNYCFTIRSFSLSSWTFMYRRTLCYDYTIRLILNRGHTFLSCCYLWEFLQYACIHVVTIISFNRINTYIRYNSWYR